MWRERERERETERERQRERDGERENTQYGRVDDKFSPLHLPTPVIDMSLGCIL